EQRLIEGGKERVFLTDDGDVIDLGEHAWLLRLTGMSQNAKFLRLRQGSSNRLQLPSIAAATARQPSRMLRSFGLQPDWPRSLRFAMRRLRVTMAPSEPIR